MYISRQQLILIRQALNHHIDLYEGLNEEKTAQLKIVLSMIEIIMNNTTDSVKIL